MPSATAFTVRPPYPKTSPAGPCRPPSTAPARRPRAHARSAAAGTASSARSGGSHAITCSPADDPDRLELRQPRRQPLDQRVPQQPVPRPHPPQVPVELAARHEVRERQLVDHRRTAVVRQLRLATSARPAGPAGSATRAAAPAPASCSRSRRTRPGPARAPASRRSAPGRTGTPRRSRPRSPSASPPRRPATSAARVSAERHRPGRELMRGRHQYDVRPGPLERVDIDPRLQHRYADHLEPGRAPRRRAASLSDGSSTASRR